MPRLSFCALHFIDHSIVEIIIDDGVEIDGEMVDEFFAAINGQMNEEISILLNKERKYSYKFDALIKLSGSTKIRNMGVVTYDALSKSTVLYMMDRFNKSNKNVKIFDNRGDALSWLKMITQ